MASTEPKRKRKAPEDEKRERVDNVEKLFSGVVEAIEQAEGLNEDCRAMLAAAVPWLIRRARAGAQKHELQACVQGWLGEIFRKVKEQLQRSIAASDTQVSEVESDHEDLAGKVGQALTALTRADQLAETSAVDAGRALQAVEVARARLGAARHESARSESAHDLALKSKQRFEDIIAKHLGPLKTSAEAEDSAKGLEAGRHLMVLAPLLQDCGLDESLLESLALSLRRPKAERAPADVAILGQLDATLTGRAVELQTMAEAQFSQATDCKRAEAGAEKDLMMADEAQKAAAQDAKEAKVFCRRAAAAVQDAQAVLAAFEERLTTARASKKEKVEALERFAGFNTKCLDILCGKAGRPKKEGFSMEHGFPL